MAEDVVGIEGGGTRTTWVRVAPDGTVRARGEAGPGNTLLLDDATLRDLFRTIARGAGSDVVAIGGGFAGCGRATEQKRVEKFLREAWPGAATVRVMEDTRSILAATFDDGPGIVVIAGTGSNVAGQSSLDSPIEKAGGWGHLFSDRGSAYDLARRGLEAVFARWDANRKITELGRAYLKAAKLDSLEELVPFLLRDTSKTTVASYAHCVFEAASRRDAEAKKLIHDAAAALAENVAVVAKRLKVRPIRAAMTGGLFENASAYRHSFTAALRKIDRKLSAFSSLPDGALGAARVAALEAKRVILSAGINSSQPAPPPKEAALKPIAEPNRLAAFSAASTEQRNPRSRGLDRRSIPNLVDLFIREERHVERALFAQRAAIARAAALVAKKLQAGGRLIYVGAGTSGRLGVVDASEMPPTFNASPEQIQAVMAGGPAAVFKSQEGAEDARDTAVAELRARGLKKNDVVCGIAASGQTPFVLAALEEARRRGAGTILVSCNPLRRLRVPVDVAIDLPTGPELVTGSTRLKAGTVTKLVLNMFSTIAMVRLGRVKDNLMINVQATNDKLRARAVRLVVALAGVSADEAQRALEKTGWRVPAALEAVRRPQAKRSPVKPRRLRK